MKSVVNFAFRHWKWVIALTGILSVISLYFLAQIRIDNSIETLSIDDDPKLALLQQAENTFGGNEFVAISFKGDDIFSPRVLAMIQAITSDIQKIDNVEFVLSLTNAEIAKNDQEGLGTTPLIPKNHNVEEEANDLREAVIANRMYEKLLYSDDGNATSIIAWLVPLGNDDVARWRVVNTIKEVLATHKDDRQFHLYGFPITTEILYRVTLEDQLVLPIILSVLIGIILFLIFRDIRMVILPFIVIDITCLWVMGFFSMEGNTLDIVTFIIPSVLMIVCLCDAVHIMSEYCNKDIHAADRVAALKEIIAHIGIPILLTSLTTVVGFFSLATSNIRSIRNFGMYTGLGVTFAFFVSVALLPLLMAIIPVKKGEKKENPIWSMLDGILSRLGQWIPKRKKSLIVVTIILMGVCVTGIMKIESKMVILGMLKKSVGREITAAHHFVDVEMAGSAEFNVLFQSDSSGTLLTPDKLKTIDRVQRRFIDMFGVLKTLSIADYLKEMNQVLNGNDPAFYRIPDTQEEIDELMEIYFLDGKDEDLEEVISFDRDEARIRLFTYTATDSSVTRRWTNQAEEILNEEVNKTSMSAEITGRPIVWVDMVESLITEMMKTFSLAFFLIFCVMFILFRSWKLGVISAVVNVIPITVTFGCIGWFNISLNMATAMLPSIAIGIAVDDTIHFIWRFEKEFRRHGTYHDAVVHTLTTVGKPIVITTILICTGFATMLFSRLTVFTEFGLLLSLTVAAALLSDLFVAPALMLLVKPFKLTAEDEGDEQIMNEGDMVTD